MATRSIWRWISVATLVVGGVHMSVAAAQEAQNQGGPHNEAELTTQRQANLSGPEQLTEANRIITTITSIRRRVSDMLDRARQERDIIKVNCLNDKLTQIDVTLRSAHDHQELLQTAVGINNDGQRNHEFALMTIFRGRADGLEAEARQCIGEEAGGFGEGTTVTVRVSPSIPAQDTTDYPSTPLIPDRPLVISPVL